MGETFRTPEDIITALEMEAVIPSQAMLESVTSEPREKPAIPGQAIRKLYRLDQRLSDIETYRVEAKKPPSDERLAIDVNEDWSDSLEALKRLADKEAYLIDSDGNAYVAAVFSALIEAAYTTFHGNGSLTAIMKDIQKVPERFSLRKRLHEDLKRRYYQLAELEDNAPEFPEL